MSYKVLGQIAPFASADEVLYIVPAERAAVVSSLIVCNRGEAAAGFRVSIRPGGVALDPEHYIYYDVEVQGNSTFVFTGGITLAATDEVNVGMSEDGQELTFSLFGKEIT